MILRKTKQDIIRWAKNCLRTGGKIPIDRVMINDFESMSSHHYRIANYRTGGVLDLTFSVILIRDDGWVLAAPPGHEKAAYKLWEDTWLCMIRHGIPAVIILNKEYNDALSK